MEITQESLYLLISNREKCKVLLNNPNPSPDEISELLISLHLVLELGINAFVRQIILMQLQKRIDRTRVASNLDNISFIDKISMFIYMPSFTFSEVEKEDADRYHSAIGKMRNFAGVRNKLLHGHMVGAVHHEDGSTSETETALLLNEKTVENQVRDFVFILKAISFYFDHWNSGFTVHGKADIKNEYLDSSFLNDYLHANT